MIDESPDPGWRVMALAVALVAITLNFLQPLVHAALLRDGPLTGPRTVLCNAAAAEDPDGKTRSPPGQVAQNHECCFGLAHAHALTKPSTYFRPIAYVQRAIPVQPGTQPVKAVGTRDGPHRPRGPPTLA